MLLCEAYLYLLCICSACVPCILEHLICRLARPRCLCTAWYARMHASLHGDAGRHAAADWRRTHIASVPGSQGRVDTTGTG